jgi:hypothetical protein
MRGFVQDIEDLAAKNGEFRRVLYTDHTRREAGADHEQFDGQTTE